MDKHRKRRESTRRGEACLFCGLGEYEGEDQEEEKQAEKYICMYEGGGKTKSKME
jgi:hypothetical protein